MKKLVSLLSSLLICILCISCFEGSPQSAYSQFSYPEDEIVAMQIVRMGEPQENGFFELETIVDIEDVESALKEFREMVGRHCMGRPFIDTGDIGLKIDYANGHYQIFVRLTYGNTCDPDENDPYESFGTFGIFAFEKDEFFNFLIKYVEMYGGDVQIVLDRLAEYNN